MIKRFNALQATSQSKAKTLEKLQMEYDLLSQASCSHIVLRGQTAIFSNGRL